MKKLRIVLTLLGVLFGAVMLFSFATPKNKQQGKEQQAKKFTGTKWSVKTVTSVSGTTITFTPLGEITGQQKGTNYHCDFTKPNVCTVTTTGSSVVTDNGDGTFTVTNATIDNSGSFVSGL